MADIFISYSHTDKAVARALHELLTAEGWEVWFDPKIPAGVRWQNSIREGLRDVKCVVVLWSPRSVRSKWVLRESRTALEARKLVPAIIEACKLPAPYAQIEAAEMQGWTGDPHPELEVLTAGIARIAPPSRIDTVRPGFDTAFLGREIGLPSVVGVAEELKYLHFSVVMNPARRLAWYVAYNMRRMEDELPERPDSWMPDPLIPRSFQPRDEHFRGMGFDRGHIARSLAVAWGDTRSAGIARRQAFFWTNTSPQSSEMNRRWWLAAEEWEASVIEARGRAIGYSGPILHPDDPLHRTIEETVGRLIVRQTFRIPRAYWKVVVAPRDDDELEIACFLIPEQPEARGAPTRDATQLRVPLERIEELTGLEFPAALRGLAPLG